MTNLPSASAQANSADVPVDLAIAILTRDRWATLARCLDSIYDQAATNDVPIHVLVNGSDDDTADRLPEAYPDVVVHVAATNLGVARGRNNLMDHIDARWVLHLDDDGTVGPRFVEKALLEVSKATPDTAVIAGHIIDVDLDPDPYLPTGPGYRFSGGVCILDSPTFSRLGGYPVDGYRQGEEGDYAIRVHEADLRIWQTAEIVLFHPLLHGRVKRVELMRTGLTQAVVTGVRFAPWWAVVPWVAWKLLAYGRLAVRLRAPGDYLAGVSTAFRLLPATARRRSPVRLRSMLAGSGRFNERLNAR